MEEKYTKKEDARMHLDQAFRDYFKAADDYGLEQDQVISEVNDIFYEQDIALKVVEK